MSIARHKKDTEPSLALNSNAYSSLSIIMVIVMIATIMLSSGYSYYSNQLSAEDSFKQKINLPSLSPEELKIQFHSSNNALRRLTIEEAESLTLSPQVESILREMASDLLGLNIQSQNGSAENNSELNISQAALSRFQFLIKKALPGSSGETVSDLIPDYMQYLTAEKNLFAKKNTKTRISPEEELTRLAASKKLRIKYLGAKNARKLFGAQELLGEYMLRRQVINSDTDLSKEEKGLRLQKAAHDFQLEQESFSNE